MMHFIQPRNAQESTVAKWQRLIFAETIVLCIILALFVTLVIIGWAQYRGLVFHDTGWLVAFGAVMGMLIHRIRHLRQDYRSYERGEP